MGLLSGVTCLKALWVQVSGTLEEKLEWKQMQNAAGYSFSLKSGIQCPYVSNLNKSCSIHFQHNVGRWHWDFCKTWESQNAILQLHLLTSWRYLRVIVCFIILFLINLLFITVFGALLFISSNNFWVNVFYLLLLSPVRTKGCNGLLPLAAIFGHSLARSHETHLLQLSIKVCPYFASLLVSIGGRLCDEISDVLVICPSSVFLHLDCEANCVWH